MGRRKTAGYRDLVALYPHHDLDGFIPDHQVEVRDRRVLLRKDLVDLHAGAGVRFAYTPESKDPRYAVLANGLWQALTMVGRVRAWPVVFRGARDGPAQAPGVVYFAQAGEGGPIKIGWSGDVRRRVTELQVGNPEGLRILGTVPGTMADEQAMHARFSHLNIRGEWFKPADELIRIASGT